MKKTLVFGGWAVSPEILGNVFGDDEVDYIDVNKIMPELFDDSDRLKFDWPQVTIDKHQLIKNYQYDIIAGWSTGAMFAYAVARELVSRGANKYHPKELILLSATPCFCRKGDFRVGTRPSVLDQMINTLNVDKDAVLKSFYERSGLNYDRHAIPNYTTHELSRGLAFLKQADLRPLAELPVHAKLYHGADDRIIPVSASKYFSEQIGGEFAELSGGHAFFTGDSLYPANVAR